MHITAGWETALESALREPYPGWIRGFRMAEPLIVSYAKGELTQFPGNPESIEGRVIYVANPEYFGVYARRLLKRGIRVIGGCCGTRPEHIQRMAQALRMMGGGRSPGATPISAASAIPRRIPDGVLRLA